MTNYPNGARSLPLQILEKWQKRPDYTRGKAMVWFLAQPVHSQLWYLLCGFKSRNSDIYYFRRWSLPKQLRCRMGQYLSGIWHGAVIDSCWLELEMRLLNWQCVTQTRNGICLMWFYMKSEEFIGQMFFAFSSTIAYNDSAYLLSHL